MLPLFLVSITWIALPQLERLTEAYLASVVSLEEYRRRRQDLERRAQGLTEQQRQLEMQVDRRQDLSG